MLGLLTIFFIHSTSMADTPDLNQGNKTTPIPKKQDSLNLTEGKTMYVSRFSFSGNQAIATPRLQQVVASYQERMLSQSDLNVIKQRILSLYQTNGYPDAQAVISQNQGSGTLSIQIVEGKKQS